ncbi:MAG: ABC transporter ATP-binding protein [Kiritimatiellia bacterium]
MKTAVSTTGLVKKYGSAKALNGLTVSIPAYSITGMVGANGAGKTTWMMAVAGYLKTSGGTITLLGKGPYNPDIHRGRISILPQDSELPLESYPLETLVFYGRLQGLKKKEALESARAILEAVHLKERMNSPIRSLSHGMRKRVMIAQCFIGSPELILLDEPLSGLDPREVANMRRFILNKSVNQSIVISSHNLHDLELLCNYVAFIKNGKTARTAPMDDITRKSAMLSYTLTRMSEDIADIEALLPECTFEKDRSNNILTCRFNNTNLKPEQINAILIPQILKKSELITVEKGASFEKKALFEL